MNERYALRSIRGDEFEAWARTIANSYGEDRRAVDLANERSTLELDRTIAAFEGDTPVGGAASCTRTMTLPGAVTQPIAGVTWVGVAPTHRRRGILTAMMRKQLTDLHDSGGAAIAVLNAAEATIYGRFGYGVSSRAMRLDGEKRSMAFRPEVEVGLGTIRLLTLEQARPLMETVYESVRLRTVGWLDRPSAFWGARLYDEEHTRDGATAFRFAAHTEPDGAVTGYALYRLKSEEVDSENRSVVRVVELAATTQQAHAALWRFLIGIDLHPRINYEGALDEPLTQMLIDARSVRATLADRLWVRLIDVDRALASRRYTTPLDIVFEVEDSFCPWNAGRYRLRAESDAVTCERTRASADLRLSSRELGAIFLGGVTLASLAAAGLVTELRPGAVSRCTQAFRGEREPFYPAGWAFPAY